MNAYVFSVANQSFKMFQSILIANAEGKLELPALNRDTEVPDQRKMTLHFWKFFGVFHKEFTVHETFVVVKPGNVNCVHLQQHIVYNGAVALHLQNEVKF